MNDKDLYKQILGVNDPWEVEKVTLQLDQGKVEVRLGKLKGIHLPCPECNEYGPIYDHVERKWRHLDTCQLQTILIGQIPRVECKKHGVKQISVPWSEKGSSFTSLFENLIICWLKEASISAVSKNLRITWAEADGVKGRAVKRGLSRREEKDVEHIGIDETSFQKRHEYVTIIQDKGRNVVLDVLDGRKAEDVEAYLNTWSEAKKSKVLAVSMDMWKAYIKAVNNTVPNAEDKICFDRFHVAQYFCNAVNKIRSAEHRQLSGTGKSILAQTKNEWLKNSQNIDNRSRRDFMKLTRSSLKTARAWAIKEAASKLWDFTIKVWAEKGWNNLLRWMAKSRQKPMIKLKNTIKDHLWGILNSIDHGVNNAKSESLNGGIQKLKRDACGFRNRKRFRNAILFKYGGLDMTPTGCPIFTHINS